MTVKTKSAQQSNVLGRRLARLTLLTGLVLTLLFTAVQTWMNYQDQLASVQTTFQQIKEVQVKGIETALWNYSKPELKAQIQGLVHFPYINYVEIRENDQVLISAGKRKNTNTIQEIIPLTYKETDNTSLTQIGILTLQADASLILRSALSQVIRLFSFQALTVLSVFLIYFVLIEREVTQHLRAAAQYFQTVDINNINVPLKLKKKNKHDEIDAFVDEYNSTRKNLALAYSMQHESERKYATLLSNLPGMAFRKRNDDQWTMELISAGCLALTGYKPEELNENAVIRFTDLIYPSDRGIVWDAIQKGLDQTRAYELTYRIRARDGQIKWLWERGIGIYAENQSIIAIEGFATDITERKQQELELEMIGRVSYALRTANTEEEMLPAILDQIVRLLNIDGIALEMIDFARDDSVIKLAYGSFQTLQGRRFAVDHGVRKQIQESGKPYINNQAAEDPAGLFPDSGISCKAAGGVPMIALEQIIGFLWIKQENDISEKVIRSLTVVADIAANAIHRARLFAQTELRLKRLIGLMTIDRAINSNKGLSDKLNLLLEQSIGLLHVDMANLCLLDDSRKNFSLQSGMEFGPNGINPIKIGMCEECIDADLVEHRLIGMPDISQGLSDDHWLTAYKQQGYRAYFAVPLIGKNEVKGIFQVFLKTPHHPDKDWLEFMGTLAGQATIAVGEEHLLQDLKRSNQELHQAYDETIEGWSNALDLRDKETEGHSQRVCGLTLALARKMGIQDEDLVNIRRGSLLHDIGKMGVPDHILFKPDKLNEEEWHIMRKHPVYAYNLLSSIDYLHPALDIPYGHHEKWDGSGYPQGISGLEIPLAARIFAVVDVFDALTSDRPYRKALTHKQAVDYIVEQSGKHFDPEIVTLFVQFLKDGEVN